MPRTANRIANIENAAPDRLLSMGEVCAISGYSRPSIYRLIGEGQFPCPLKLGRAKIMFKASEVLAWIDSRPRALGHQRCEQAA